MLYDDLKLRDDLIHAYTIRRNPKPLADAIRNGDPDINWKRMRYFIADIVEGRTKLPPPKETLDDKTYDRNFEILEKIHTYKSAGVPISNLNTRDCCDFIADEYGLSSETIYKKIWKRRERYYNNHRIGRLINPDDLLCVANAGHINYRYKGRMAKIYNNNSRPDSLAEFNRLEDEINSLRNLEYDALYQQAKDEICTEHYEKDKKKFRD